MGNQRRNDIDIYIGVLQYLPYFILAIFQK